MNDMTAVIVPKSDQINADDLIAGPITITIAEVDIRPGTEQPVSIFFDGDAGKPWKPCKSMSRVLVAAWGPDAKQYVGRSVTLYRDPHVKWGGMEVGGIRVSHMSHIERDMVMALTATKGKRAPYTVKPLQARQQTQQQPVDDGRARAESFLEKYAAACADAFDVDELASIHERATANVEKLRKYPDLHERALALRPQPAAGEGSIAADPANEGEEAAASPQPSLIDE